MESPFNRPIAANLIGDVLDEIGRRYLEEPFLCGFSREMSIYHALKEVGYLTEEAMVPDND